MHNSIFVSLSSFPPLFTKEQRSKVRICQRTKQLSETTPHFTRSTSQITGRQFCCRAFPPIRTQKLEASKPFTRAASFVSASLLSQREKHSSGTFERVNCFF